MMKDECNLILEKEVNGGRYNSKEVKHEDTEARRGKGLNTKQTGNYENQDRILGYGNN
jgi:hypothetical protein